MQQDLGEQEPRPSRRSGDPAAALPGPQRPPQLISVPRQASCCRKAQQPLVAHACHRPGQPRRRLLFLPRPLRLPSQEVRERLHIPGKRVGRRWSPTPPTPAPLTPADPPPPPDTVPACATAMSILNAKNLIYLQDTHNNFRFLVHSGASRSVLPHVDTTAHGSVPGGGKREVHPIQWCGSGIRCLFDPGIRNRFFSGSRIPNPYF
jgi:hypothetical protein